MNDPIVDEIRRIREAHAASFNYDLDAIYNDIKEKERASKRTFVPPPYDAAVPAEVNQQAEVPA
jgi:hypothetical protein